MGAASVDVKKTVNLPQTDFPMKANLAQMEPKTLLRWETEDLYAKIRAARAGRPMCVLHDGPPYANGNIHLGHALNKILKDFIVKLKTMEGYDSPYVPGWDCHGLPIEIKVDSELGPRKAQMTTAQIRAECRKYAAKYVDLQRADFIRLGILGQWQDPYLTMSPQYEAVIAGAFVDFLDRGYVYKGLKTVNWCMHDRTALAEAEIEYEDHTSPSIWVRFALTSDAGAIDPALAGRNVYGLIWTTTPWTIPANVAIAYHPKFEYVAVEVGDAVYIVALELLKVTAEKLGWDQPESNRRLSWREDSKARSSAIRFSIAIRSAFSPITSRWSRALARFTPLPATARKISKSASSTGCPSIARWIPPARFYHAEGAAGRLPEEIIGKTVWQANPIVSEILKIAWRAARRGKDQAQLSALLALPQFDDFPRHRAVVRRHGAQRSARPHAQSHQRREVDARLGRRAHVQHDRHPSRLVHFAPARLGRSHHRVLLRELPGADDGPQGSGSRGGAFP